MQKSEQEYLWVKDEDTGASLQREVIRIPKEVMEKIISKEIIGRLESLETQLKILRADKPVWVSNNEAKEILKRALSDFKSAGIKTIDIIDLNNLTKLPISQINEVMVQLEQEGQVSEYGESD